MGNVLTVRDLTVRYGDVTVLDGVNLDLAAGESVALMGPSGSGKSSLLACVTGTAVPSSGRVDLDGTVVSEASPAQRARLRRSLLGLMFQEPCLLPELSIEENVALMLVFDGQSRGQALKAARRALDEVGLIGHAPKRIDEISGGQAQRVALARALVRPEIRLLVADEPTASLDAATARRVIELLLERTVKLGSAVLLATHDPMVGAACDRVFDLRVVGAQT